MTCRAARLRSRRKFRHVRGLAAQPDPPFQILRDETAFRTAGRIAGPRDPAGRRIRRRGAGAAALEEAMGARVQPVGTAGPPPCETTPHPDAARAQAEAI